MTYVFGALTVPAYFQGVPFKNELGAGFSEISPLSTQKR